MPRRRAAARRRARRSGRPRATSKSANARAERLALAEDREPAQAGLEALEADLLEQAPIVADREAPFAIVIVDVERVAAGPPAPVGGRRARDHCRNRPPAHLRRGWCGCASTVCGCFSSVASAIAAQGPHPLAFSALVMARASRIAMRRRPQREVGRRSTGDPDLPTRAVAPTGWLSHHRTSMFGGFHEQRDCHPLSSAAVERPCRARSRAGRSIVGVHSRRSRASGWFWRPQLLVTASDAIADEGPIDVGRCRRRPRRSHAERARCVDRHRAATRRSRRFGVIPPAADAVEAGAMAVVVGAAEGGATAALGIVSRAGTGWRSLRGGDMGPGSSSMSRCVHPRRAASRRRRRPRDRHGGVRPPQARAGDSCATIERIASKLEPTVASRGAIWVSACNRSGSTPAAKARW